MSRTAQTLIEASLRVNGVTASGETPTAGELADGLEAMQMMLEEWSFEGLPVEILASISHTLVAGTASYTIGPSGCDITADWPVEIVSGYVRSSESLDYTLTIDSEQEYDRRPVKTTAGTPSRLYYRPTYPNGTIYLYYVPESAMAMVLKAITMMDNPAALATEVVFPPPYDSAIKWNLALLLAPEFGKEPSQVVVTKALHSRAIIEARNAMTRTEPIRVPIGHYHRNYSINEG